MLTFSGIRVPNITKHCRCDRWSQLNSLRICGKRETLSLLPSHKSHVELKSILKVLPLSDGIWKVQSILDFEHCLVKYETFQCSTFMSKRFITFISVFTFRAKEFASFNFTSVEFCSSLFTLLFFCLNINRTAATKKKLLWIFNRDGNKLLQYERPSILDSNRLLYFIRETIESAKLHVSKSQTWMKHSVVILYENSTSSDEYRSRNQHNCSQSA